MTEAHKEGRRVRGVREVLAELGDEGGWEIVGGEDLSDSFCNGRRVGSDEGAGLV